MYTYTGIDVRRVRLRIFGARSGYVLIYTLPHLIMLYIIIERKYQLRLVERKCIFDGVKTAKDIYDTTALGLLKKEERRGPHLIMKIISLSIILINGEP